MSSNERPNNLRTLIERYFPFVRHGHLDWGLVNGITAAQLLLIGEALSQKQDIGAVTTQDN